MPFLGTTPTQGFVSSFPKQSFTPNGSTTVFTLTNPVASANDLEVFVGNVRQEPTAAYSAAGTTLTMTEAPASGLNFYVINKSFAQVTTNTPDGSVSTAKILDDAVTGAKIENNPTIAGNLTVSGTSTNTGLITASSGIAIGGTGAANTLDDYEEGTYTPVLTGNTTGSGTTMPLSSNYNVLSYTKIGRQVTVNGKVETSGSHSASGYLKCSLPFVVADLAKVSGSGAGNVFFYRTGDGLHTNPVAIPSENSSIILFYQSTGGGDVSTINAQDMDSAIEFFITVIYFTT